MCRNVAAKCAFYSGFSLNTVCIFMYCQRKVAPPAEQRSFNQRIIAHPANLIALYMNQCLADQAYYFSPHIVRRIPKQRAQAQHAFVCVCGHWQSFQTKRLKTPRQYILQRRRLSKRPPAMDSHNYRSPVSKFSYVKN